LELSKIDEIWDNKLLIALDDTSTHENNLEFQIGEFLDLLKEFDSNSFEFFTLVYLELD
jgi:hypothetical protein